MLDHPRCVRGRPITFAPPSQTRFDPAKLGESRCVLVHPDGRHAIIRSRDACDDRDDDLCGPEPRFEWVGEPEIAETVTLAALKTDKRYREMFACDGSPDLIESTGGAWLAVPGEDARYIYESRSDYSGFDGAFTGGPATTLFYIEIDHMVDGYDGHALSLADLGLAACPAASQPATAPSSQPATAPSNQPAK
jgi:hypothetical protein